MTTVIIQVLSTSSDQQQYTYHLLLFFLVYSFPKANTDINSLTMKSNFYIENRPNLL